MVDNKNKKSIKVGLIIFLSVFAVVLIFGVVIVSINIIISSKKFQVGTDPTYPGFFFDEYLYKHKTIDKEIGNDKCGYLTVPESIEKISESNDISIYKLGEYTLSMYSKEYSEINKKNYVLNCRQNMEDEGAIVVKVYSDSVGEYKANRIIGYYIDDNLQEVYEVHNVWCFEPGDGRVHYIDITGTRDIKSWIVDIINTFSLTKKK